MKHYKLDFQGYTWDEYFYVIADKQGILVTYRGCLDNEGSIKIEEIVCVGESDCLRLLYESKDFQVIRNKISGGDRLFFSYAEKNSTDRKEVVDVLKHHLQPNSNIESMVKISCKGACALFPNEILEA